MNIVFISQVFEVRTVRIYLFLYAQNNWTKFQVRLRGLLVYTMKQRSSVFYLARRASSYFSGQSSGLLPRDFHRGISRDSGLSRGLVKKGNPVPLQTAPVQIVLSRSHPNLSLIHI